MCSRQKRWGGLCGVHGSHMDKKKIEWDQENHSQLLLAFLSPLHHVIIFFFVTMDEKVP